MSDREKCNYSDVCGLKANPQVICFLNYYFSNRLNNVDNLRELEALISWVNNSANNSRCVDKEGLSNEMNNTRKRLTQAGLPTGPDVPGFEDLD